mmetsp:Transcript_4767/g.8185  ORF Transcript_4767/g.8185 Transcript_4767/m.8185 type:complete len:149 (+) Transcript_4767:298-744(+)|eukprot:CAMPEP_0198200842 /NCGR_PEP_ID=MMETSP1445-20131203/3758_1 /TAXON_ID=36898 /ORGANISM="Pyramimonas sp., Strain CCMP2087" /LENGTH=148 /DNA_ID=CAMNT_0043871003 /DNA_START=284 /DNA_END=730 /DNA_ORIENTATION=+
MQQISSRRLLLSDPTRLCLSGRCSASRLRSRPLLVQASKTSGSEGSKEKGPTGKPPVAYTINIVSPPPKCLGVHMLPHNTQCGELVEVGEGSEAKEFIVQKVSYVYKLVKGRYEAKEFDRKLYVQSTGRFLVNKYLTDMYERPSSKSS